MVELFLKSGREKSLLRRHPWIFSGAIARWNGTPCPGETIMVRDAKGNFLARAAASPHSMISARVWSFQEDEEIGKAFLEQKIAQAMELRKKIFKENLPEAYRLVNAESDGLPGLIVDVYGDYGVCQISAAGTEAFRKEIGEILLQYVKGGYERSDVDSRKKEGLELRTGPLCGEELPERLSFVENGIQFEADPRNGHKTGFYLDQRCNRKAVMDAAADMEDVLNCFCYTGGFGLAAAKGGAKRVLNVDSSLPALKIAQENARRNGFHEEQFRTEEADVFQFLRTCRDSRKTFDLIILDPPKFAETAAQVDRAARAYKDINLLALKLLRPGGRLFTYSCSGAMDDSLFGKVVDSAACDAGVDFRITNLLMQGPDHPVSAAFPEGRYLKGIAGFRM